MDPFCSVIIPTHRRPDQLAECLGALAALDYPADRFEVIVVDDGGGMPLEPVLGPFRDRIQLTLSDARGRRPRGRAQRRCGSQARGELLASPTTIAGRAPDWLRPARRAPLRRSPGTASGAGP